MNGNRLLTGARQDPSADLDDIRVLVVDDDPASVRVMVALLHTTRDLRVTATAGCRRQAHDALRRHDPQVVVCDQVLPDGLGTDLARASVQEGLRSRFVILSGRTDELLAADALRAGCAGYVAKTHDAGELIGAVRAAARGDVFLSSELVRHMVSRLRPQDEPSPARDLTERERKVLHLITQGLDNGSIAWRLSISRNTVATHVQNILRKLRVHSKLEASAAATRLGLVRLPEIGRVAR